MSERPTAFVIMPFDAELNEVYSDLIVPTLTEAGYSVLRADDLYGQRNILRDIVESISNSALIVADLTGLNPNVFYELGVAHGLRRPVILLTQNLDELPFDLRSYRVVIYDTHFARVKSAREALRQTALGAIRGEIEFGSPVSDFSASQGGQPSRARRESPAESTGEKDDDDDDDEPGWLDHQAAIEDGFKEITAILASVTEATAAIGETTQAYSKRLDIVKATQGQHRSSSIRFIANEYSRDLVQYGEKISSANDAYEQVARGTQDGLEFIISHATIGSEEDRQSLLSLVDTLRGVQTSAGEALDSFRNMRETIRSIEGIEKSMTRGARVVGREIERFIGNVEKTLASVQRGVEIGSMKLESSGEGQVS